MHQFDELQSALKNFNEDAVLDLLNRQYKKFYWRDEADSFASFIYRQFYYRTTSRTYIVPLTETADEAFRAIQLESFQVGDEEEEVDLEEDFLIRLGEYHAQV